MRKRADIISRSNRVCRSLTRVACIWLSLCAPALAQTTIDLDANEEDLRVLGEVGSGLLGFSVAGGDVDGDGIEDMIIGAYGATPNGRTSAGITYIVCGDTSSVTTPLDLADGPAGGVDMVILGAGANDQLGRSVAAADVDGDGIDDIIVGSLLADPGSLLDAGMVYVVYGGSVLPDTLDLFDEPADLTLLGVANSDNLGTAVAGGDLNGDGFADVIAGAGRTNGLTGTAYVVYGDSTFAVPDTLDMSENADKSIEIVGVSTGDNLGNAMATGNLNGDGADDLILGAMLADPDGIRSGAVYVIYGDTADTTGGFTAINASSADVTVTGGAAFDRAGQSVAAGDVNGDGIDDVIIGASAADPAGMSGAGQVYILYGTLSGDVALPGGADVTISGEAALSSFGWSMAALNLNGDGFADLLIGANAADTPGATRAGQSLVILGDPQLASQIDLWSTAADIAIYGDDDDDANGYAVGAGDLNGDFVADLILGAPLADTPVGGEAAGEVYVIYGEAPYVELSVPDTTATYDESLVVPVRVDSTNGLKMAEVDLHLTFDSDLLTFNTVLDAGTLLNAWTVNAAVEPGSASTVDTLKISASTNGAAATGEGVLLNIDFTVLDVRHPATSMLDSAHVHFNGGRPEWVRLSNGSVLLLGNDGSLATTIVSTPGDTVRIRATDADLNVDPPAIETVTVEVVNSETDELETVDLVELTVDDSVFFGTVTTVFGAGAGVDNDGEFNTQDGDSLFTAFEDSLNAAGISITFADTSFVIDPLGDASGNGTAQAFDAARILAHSVGHITLADHDSMAANVDSLAPFGPITAFDAALVIRQRVGLIGRFPIQEDESLNHPQPQTDQSVPKAVVEGRPLALRAGDGYVVVWLEERGDILSGDLFVDGADIESSVITGPEMSNALLDSRHDGERLRIAFALDQPIAGPGELLRIVMPRGPGTSAAALMNGLTVQGDFNDASIRATSAGGLEEARPSSSPIPTALSLHANYPNPFNGETSIHFDLPEAGLVELAVYNALGQQVRSLAAEELQAGTHALVWDARDEGGHTVASGTYLYVLRAGELVRSRQLMVIK